jgi:glycosyltransferase involved in cell wall biosynthesis
MRIKIIHILSHSPGEGYNIDLHDPNCPLPPHYFKTATPPHWVGFFEKDFHILIANEIEKQAPDIQQECWRPYDVADRVYSKVINGITHRLFPSKKVRLGRFILGERSTLMIQRLREIVEQGNVIVHLHGLHKVMFYRFFRKAGLNKVPVFTTQRGDGYPTFFIKRKPWLALKWLVEEVLYRQIDHFFIQSSVEYDYLAHKYGNERVTQLQDGLSFQEFNPPAREESRKCLGIPESAKVLLYIGQYDTRKGVENILWAFRQLKMGHPPGNDVSPGIVPDADIEGSEEEGSQFTSGNEELGGDRDIRLYMIGGHTSNELYAEARECGAILLPRIAKSELMKYYSSADLCLYPTSNQFVRNFAGISNANIESLACGTPIYTSQLIHFMGTNEEKKKVGVQFEKREDMLREITGMLEHPERYSDCREIARKYYDRSRSARTIIATYRKEWDRQFG